ncbi:MAG: Ldh family oxidoreductase [Opitutaceae bacterium]|nr:Ldh family oxidoreductase [Opitutaceae bacterium]
MSTRKKPSAPLTITFRAKTLVDYCQDLLVSLGTPRAYAHLVGHSLVAANLRGVDSHGIQMLLTYIQQQRAGGMDVKAAGRVQSRKGACLLYNGGNGLGQVVADRCVDQAIRIAARHGVGLVVANHSNHLGACAYWAQKMTRAGYVGIVMTNACPAAAPWQGRTPIFGTNPICMAVPGSGPCDWLLDMATTTVALGKIGHASQLNRPTIPLAWGFLDAKGNPTTSTEAALKGVNGVPFPTPTGGYKGSGLAMMVEILCAGLSGGAMTTDLPVYRTGGDPIGVSHMFLAIDPGRFLPRPVFRRRMDRLKRLVKASKPAKGYREVLVAGEPEWREEQVRAKRGIPIPTKLWTRFVALGAELGVPAPQAGGRR